jgi:hypothetical protein
MNTTMIPVGYMAKYVRSRPDWLKAGNIVDIYSVSNCISSEFADYINDWMHNGYWFFDSPQIIRDVAQKHAVDLAETRLFYYEIYEKEFLKDKKAWTSFEPEPTFKTDVLVPENKHLEGYDIVSFSAGTSPECSPLSCNSLADAIATNSHCLLESFDLAKNLLLQGKFSNAEPGPYRIFAVHSLAPIT